MQKTPGKYSRSVQENFKQTKDQSGQAAALNVKKNKYQEVLQFLMPHNHERSTISNIEQPSENDSNVANSRVMAYADDETREEISVKQQECSYPPTQNPTKEEEDRTT
jgi:hypothetical protein